VAKEKRIEVAGTRFKVKLKQNDVISRNFSKIKKLIEYSSLSSTVKEKSIEIFQNLAEVEGRIHMKPLEKVHFHEVGAVDSIVDIVGVVIGIDYLGIQRIYSSPLHLGTGFVKTRHGFIPIPAPATIALLEGVPTVGTDIKAELVTPTGAAIITALAEGYGPSPAMEILSVGYGVGTRNLSERPNLLRIVLGNKIISNNEILSDNRSQSSSSIC